MLNQDLYRTAYLRPLLKCITKDLAEYVLKEIHEEIWGNHLGAWTMAAKVLKISYYLPTVQGDYVEFVKKCTKCLEFDPLHHLKLKALHSMTSPWSFVIWEIDIVGPFATRKGQKKFLLVRVDYFTEWIKVESLASIFTKSVLNFV